MNTSFEVDNLKVSIYENAQVMGEAAADYVADVIKSATVKKGQATIILATGASQFSFFESLNKKEIDWQKVTVFHLDEYIGLGKTHPASFRRYLEEKILDEVQPKQIFFLNGDAEDLDVEMSRYEQELKNRVIDLACIGIGENGHIAFNDPPIADFNDPKLVKIAKLDDACRNQQFGEGWFPSLEDVPSIALTLTVPAIMRCETISCVVPDDRKAEAVKNTLYGEINTNCPATILRSHPNTNLFLDTAAAGQINL